jgi:hypothetical protein
MQIIFEIHHFFYHVHGVNDSKCEILLSESLELLSSF